MDTLKQIKSQISILQMADTIGLPYQEKRGKATANCPFCDDEHGHLYLYSDSNRYHCFKCSASGDNIDLAVKGFKYSIETLKMTFGHNGTTPKISTRYEPVKKPKAPSNSLPDHSDLYFEIAATQSLSESGRAYLSQRGLTDEIIDRYSITSIDDPRAFFGSLMERYSQDDLLAAGLIDYNAKGKLYSAFFMPAILFVHLSSDLTRFTGLSTRNLAGDTKSFKLHGTPSAYYYGMDTPQSKEIYVFEGIINALSYAILTGRDNFIATSGLITPSKYDDLKLMHPNQKLILGLDPDEAGQKALSKISKCTHIDWAAFALQLGFKGLQKHSNGKAWDINDYLVRRAK